MKQAALKTALACAAGVAFSGSALAWDGDITYSGTAANEYHTLMLDIRACQVIFPGCNLDLESQRIYKVFNQSTATPVVDTITDCSATDASGNATNWATVVNEGWDPNSMQTFGDPAGPLPSDRSCSIESDAEGRAISHRILNIVPAGMFPSAIFYTEFGSATRNVELGVTSGTASGVIDIDEVTSAITDADIASGPAAIATAINTVTGLSGWGANSISNLHYLTCDTTYGGDGCGGSAKAVPVPAFAAGALALGLIGVTYVSGRRRSVKK